MADPKSWRRVIAAVKVEADYGVMPADMTDAVLVELVTREAAGYYEGNTVERERVRGGFGAFEQINAGPHTTRQIRVPYSGSGTKGVAPAYSALLRACGLSETIDETVGDEKVTYAPVSDGFDSITILWWEDGQLQQVSGARGTVTTGSDSQSLPYFEFALTGLYKRPETAVAVDGAVATLAGEVPVNKQNSAFSMFGFAARMQSLSLDIGNTVEYRNLVGYEGVHITDRRASGQINIEAPHLDDFNVFEKAESHNGTEVGNVTFTHGQTAGNIVELTAARAQLSSPSASDNQGIMHYALDLRLLPDGNDDGDFTLVFK